MQLALTSEPNGENGQGPLTLIDNGRGKGKGKPAGKGKASTQQCQLAYQSCLFTDYLTLNFQHPASVELLMNQVHFTNI